MSRLWGVRAGLAAVGVMAAFAARATAPEAVSFDVDALESADCFGSASCEVHGADVTASGGTLQKKTLNDVSGYGVSGGASGPEIDIGQTLAIDFGGPRSVLGIKILFLFNGPEFSDRAEKASVVADGTTYTLAVGNDSDDADATWSGPGTVSKCGDTTGSGIGCFLISDPFPGMVSELQFTAIEGGPPYSGPGTNESDYSIAFIDVAATTVIELTECANPSGCAVATVGGTVAFSLSSVQAQNQGGSTEAIVIPVQLPDCRYVPHVCLGLLPPAGDSAPSDDAARGLLIALGVIRTLDPTGPARLNPAAQHLNVTPLLPPEVTSLFDDSGTPPDGLPPLWIGPRWRGQAVNDFRFDGFFFKSDSGVVFEDAFDGLIDVSLLTGDELGCFPDLGDLRAWDVISTVSETARSVGGRHADMPVNVGCENPTKVKGSRLSLYTINFEVAPDTWGRTIKSHKPRVTTNNDAVFARMVQSLWQDIGQVRSGYACTQADPLPANGVPPLSRKTCRTLASLWSVADYKIDLCVKAAFWPASGYRAWICGLASEYVGKFESALPASAAGPDVYNRLGELKTRVEVFQHVWDERFLNSLKPGGFCREWGTCAP